MDALDALLDDTVGDDAQLQILRRVLDATLELPADVHVVGEPLTLIAVEYDGNPRRGLVACCRRDDGREHRIGLADVELAPGAPALASLAAYWRWLGIAPVTDATATPAHRRHKASDDDLDLSRPVELVMLAVAQVAARCRLLGTERAITLRARSLHRCAPGQIVTVQPAKHWRHAGHPYLSGQVVATRTDAAALGLPPLRVRRCGDRAYELEQPLAGSVGVVDAQVRELDDTGDRSAAAALLARALERDLRCLEAHAGLGERKFRLVPEWALGHYEVGVSLGELALGGGFDGALPWRLAGNRGFLRCLAGHGRCLWRLGHWDEAERALARLARLDPVDGQGVSPILASVRSRQPWTDAEAER